MTDRTIIESIADLMRYYRSKQGKTRFRIEDYANAYRPTNALIGNMTPHASEYAMREHFIDEYREVFGIPKEVVCAVDGEDYNHQTAKNIAKCVEKSNRGKFGQQQAKALSKDFENRTYSKTETKRVQQLMDNGEMFVVLVDSGEILSHFVAGPEALLKMKRTFDSNEADVFSDQRSVIDSDIDALISRMNRVRGVSFPKAVLLDHGGMNVGCDFDNINWKKVSNVGIYDKFLRPSLEKCGLVPKRGDVSGVVKQAVESITGQGRFRQ